MGRVELYLLYGTADDERNDTAPPLADIALKNVDASLPPITVGACSSHESHTSIERETWEGGFRIEGDNPASATTTVTWVFRSLPRMRIHATRDGGHLLSVTVGATTYTSNFSNVVTPQGGMLTVNFATGAWTYTTPTNIPAAVDDVFNYKIVDNDGDQAPANLTVHLLPVGSQPLIYTAVDHPFWTSDSNDTNVNQDFVNRIHFFDGDLPASVQVTFNSQNASDAFNTIGSLVGVSAAGSGTNTLTLTGNIADINQFLGEHGLDS